MNPFPELSSLPSLWIRQRKELVELAGFETRNKYSIETDDNRQIGFAAEQHKGFGGFLLRQFLGHWRRFEIHVFDALRTPVLHAEHPFRFLFHKLTIRYPDGRVLGHIQWRFSILMKKFDILDAQENLLYSTSSPFWRIWTFPVKRLGADHAVIRKRWSGALKEAFLDVDQFQVEFIERTVPQEHRLLIMMAGLFVDLMYFENKANNSWGV